MDRKYLRKITFSFNNVKDAKKYYDALSDRFTGASIKEHSVSITDIFSILEDLVCIVSYDNVDAPHTLISITLEEIEESN